MTGKSDDLAKMLNKALLFEESAIVVLGNTYRTFVEENKVSGLKAAQKEQIVKILNYLVEDSEKHGRILRGLIARISGEEQDAS